MSQAKKSVVLGIVQMHSGTQPEENLARARAGVLRLAKQGAQIVALPELFLTEYFCQVKNKKYFAYAEPVPNSPTMRSLSALAKEAKVIITTSVYELAPNGKRFNTAVTIDATGKLIGKYRKMHIPDDLKNYYGEAFYFAKGDLGFRVTKTKHVPMSTMVCWDQWFPEGARIAAAKGAQLLCYPTAIGFQRKDKLGVNETEREAWQIMQRSHAIANNVFVAAVNRVGIDQHLNFWGSSFVADPYGRIIAQAPVDAEAELLVECNLSLIPQMRADWPFLKARRIKL